MEGDDQGGKESWRDGDKCRESRGEILLLGVLFRRLETQGGVKTEIQKVCLKFPYLAGEIVIHSVKCCCFHLMGCFTPCWPGTQWVTIGISMPSISRSAGLRNLRTEHISSSQLCLRENRTSLISQPGVEEIFRAHDAVTTVIIRWCVTQEHTGRSIQSVRMYLCVCPN